MPPELPYNLWTLTYYMNTMDILQIVSNKYKYLYIANTANTINTHNMDHMSYGQNLVHGEGTS